MEITHGATMAYQETQLSHRNSGIAFKTLAQGDESRADNFNLSLGRQRGFESPRHRHNFDQFRYAVRGDFDLGPGLRLREGQVSFHPEGAAYGPQQDGPEERVQLTLQFGGASGQGYVSFAQPRLRAANVALAKVGKFEGGRYVDAEGRVKDGYEAMWESLHGRELVYPAPRYQTPVLMDPESFAWRPVEDVRTKQSASGHVSGADVRAWKKTLGVFTEREVRVELFRVLPGGSILVGGPGAIFLVYVTKGAGRVGQEYLEPESTITTTQGLETEIVGEGTELEALLFILPEIFP